MERIGYEPEWVTPESVEQLDEGEGQVDAEEAQQVAGVAVGHDETEPDEQFQSSSFWSYRLRALKDAFGVPYSGRSVSIHSMRF